MIGLDTLKVINKLIEQHKSTLDELKNAVNSGQTGLIGESLEIMDDEMEAIKRAYCNGILDDILHLDV